ncbi:MAG: translational GTPase TypA [Alphaproteobacteria bacterium CG_4_10_14_0_8_um_filter_37_21]|nr:MAG: translational GTPase TypA [Alphaproteobacteria bacterium CG_4_10_14_0_8_um_filter_37_21]
MTKLRNIAIIAHVDHGKTTLVDTFLQQSGTFKDHQALTERAMDSNDLERERGITILAKCTSLMWKDTRINIVDTPGHADFGGEVERILSMVDGVILLVDAAEGPMPQTKFVLAKALKLGLKPIVLINKIDRSDERHEEVLDECFELFLNLDATDEQLDFKVVYASGRNGWAVMDLKDERKDVHCLFDLVLEHVPEPNKDKNAPFSMLATTLEADPYLGRILTGRIETGTINVNTAVKVLSGNGDVVENERITKILGFRGLNRIPLESAEAGDIIAVAGLKKGTVADTITLPSINVPIAAQPIDPPTLSMTFSINDSPLAGQEGKKLTSRMVADRLFKEAEGNVSIKITQSAERDSFDVAGRGELQLGVLIETMRREGFELSISRPRVLFQTDENGKKLEPIEEAVIDVDDEYVGSVVESMSKRKADLVEMRPSGGGKTRVVFHIPSRGLIGYHGQFLTETRGTGIMNRIFHSYGPHKGTIESHRRGALISTGDGEAVAFALFNLEERGTLFVSAGDKIYQGMVIGENSRDNDLEVNPLKGKQLTNMRASGKDEAVKLTTPKVMTLEQAISYIQDDERVEVTPTTIRIRKALLCPNERKKESRSKKD